MNASDRLDFVHLYVPPPGSGSPGPPVAEGPTLLLLHGTGGNERDLLPVSRLLLPGAGVLSPRGRVLERGMPRFFRRLSEGVFDLEDLTLRTHELADFLAAAAQRYGFDARQVVAAGFSNGANIAAALLLLRPETLAAAVLFRAMVPLVPDALPSHPGTPVLISNGRQDPLVPGAETERLVSLLERAGATVTLQWQPGGHELTPADVSGAARWLAGQSLDVRR
jgi:predicted esterase